MFQLLYVAQRVGVAKVLVRQERQPALVLVGTQRAQHQVQDSFLSFAS
jgi:hypothetical protein